MCKKIFPILFAGKSVFRSWKIEKLSKKFKNIFPLLPPTVATFCTVDCLWRLRRSFYLEATNKQTNKQTNRQTDKFFFNCSTCMTRYIIIIILYNRPCLYFLKISLDTDIVFILKIIFWPKRCLFYTNCLERLFHKRFAGPRYEINLLGSSFIVFFAFGNLIFSRSIKVKNCRKTQKFSILTWYSKLLTFIFN